jgi:hypothetical protein
MPRLRQSVIALGDVTLGAIPWPRIGSTGIEIKRAKVIDDPFWSAVVLAFPHTLLVRADSHRFNPLRGDGATAPSDER